MKQTKNSYFWWYYFRNLSDFIKLQISNYIDILFFSRPFTINGLTLSWAINWVSFLLLWCFWKNFCKNRLNFLFVQGNPVKSILQSACIIAFHVVVLCLHPVSSIFPLSRCTRNKKGLIEKGPSFGYGLKFDWRELLGFHFSWRYGLRYYSLTKL